MSVTIVLLAAGMSSRTAKDGFHKLLAQFDGEPLLRKMARVATTSKALSVVVVLGYRHDMFKAILSDLNVEIAINENFADGMASSIVSGFAAAQARNADGIMVMLADMPEISTAHLDRMIEAFEGCGGSSVVRAVCGKTPGNPVILPRSLHEAVLTLKGDGGARRLIEASGVPIIGVDVGEAAERDVDTREAIAAAGGVAVQSAQNSRH